jgi:DNA-binding PadR family transcriptional regulator
MGTKSSEKGVVQKMLPLKPQDYHILLSLSERERHGYALTKEIRASSEGRIRLEPANLYRRIRRLMADGLIDESDRRPAPDSDDERRRYYRLTSLGRRVLVAEAIRMRSLVEDATTRRLLPDAGGST